MNNLYKRPSTYQKYIPELQLLITFVNTILTPRDEDDGILAQFLDARWGIAIGFRPNTETYDYYEDYQYPLWEKYEEAAGKFHKRN